MRWLVDEVVGWWWLIGWLIVGWWWLIGWLVVVDWVVVVDG